MKKKYISTQEFDELFDSGEDISGNLDIKTAKRQELASRRASMDFPE